MHVDEPGLGFRRERLIRRWPQICGDGRADIPFVLEAKPSPPARGSRTSGQLVTRRMAMLNGATLMTTRWPESPTWATYSYPTRVNVG